MTIAVGQHTASASTAAQASPYTNTSGVTTSASGSSFLIGIVVNAGTAPTGLGASDNKGNTYSLIGTSTTNGGSAFALFLCINGTGGATHKASVSYSGSALPGAFLIEITGGVTSALVDQISSPQWNDDTSSPFTSNATATTTQANELCIAFAVTNSSSGTETLNWSADGYTAIDSLANATTVTGGTAFKYVTATGSQQTSFTSSGAGTTEGIVMLVTLKESSVTPPATPTSLPSPPLPPSLGSTVLGPLGIEGFAFKINIQPPIPVTNQSNDEIGYFETFFDDGAMEAQTEVSMMFVESAPVVANAAPLAVDDSGNWFSTYDDPELEEFEWTPYQPNAPPENRFEDHFEWSWDEDPAADDWHIIIDDDDDAINADSSTPIDDSREWSWDEDSSADDWQLTIENAVGADAAAPPTSLADDSSDWPWDDDPSADDWQLIIDDDDDAVGPSSPQFFDDTAELVVEELDDDYRPGGDDPVGADAAAPAAFPADDSRDWLWDEDASADDWQLDAIADGGPAPPVLFPLLVDIWARANGDVGPNYVNIFADGGGNRRPTIVSNAVENTLSLSSFSEVMANLPGIPADQYVKFTVNALANSSCIIVAFLRASGTVSTGYRIFVTGPLGGTATLTIAKSVAGAFTSLNSKTLTVSASDVFLATITGTSIAVYQNGAQALTATDSSISSGQPGFGITVDATAAHAILGPIEFGDFVPVPAGPEDVWDWSAEDLGEDVASIDDLVGPDAPQSIAQLFGDEAELSDEDVFYVGTFQDEYQQSDNFSPPGADDAFDWSAEEPEDDIRVGLDADLVGSDAQPYPVEDAWDWTQEDPEADAWELITDAASNSIAVDPSPRPSQEDAWDWSAEEPDEDERAWIETETTTYVDLWPEFGDDAEQADEDLSQSLISDGYIQADFTEVQPSDDSFDWVQEDPAADDWQAIIDDDDDAVGPDAVQSISGEDIFDWHSEDLDDDFRVESHPVSDVAAPLTLNSEDIFDDGDESVTEFGGGYQQSNNFSPANEESWEWSSDDVDDDIHVLLIGDVVGSSASTEKQFTDPDDQSFPNEDDEQFAVDTDPVGADGVARSIEDAWDWTAEEPDEDERTSSDADPVGVDAPMPLFPEVWNDEDDVEDLWLVIDDSTVAVADPVAFDDSAEQWWADDLLEEEIAESAPVGPDTNPNPVEDGWDWSAEDPDEDERAALDTDPVGADVDSVVAGDEWVWDDVAESDWIEDARAQDVAPLPSADDYDWWSAEVEDTALDADPVGANANPYPVEDAWDWSAEEPEDDIRVGLDASPVGANGATAPFPDEWDWAADGIDEDSHPPPEFVQPPDHHAMEDVWDWSVVDIDDEMLIDAGVPPIATMPVDDAWAWGDEVENEFDFDQSYPQKAADRAYDDDMGLFLLEEVDSIDWYQDQAYTVQQPIQYFEDPADFWTQDSDDDIYQRLDAEPVGLDAHTYPKYEEFDWSADDSEFSDADLFGGLDYAPIGGLTERWLVYAAAVRALLIEPTDVRHLAVTAPVRFVNVAAPAVRLIVVHPSGPRHLMVTGEDPP